MRLVEATLVNNEIEPGWPILRESVPLGTRYQADLDDIQEGTITSRVTGRSCRVACIACLQPNGQLGYIPLIALRLTADG